MPAPTIVVTLLMLAADGASVPICDSASHDRLVVRTDRDVCAPTLDRRRRPIAMGLLPTRCAEASRDYRIDAVGQADRCVVATAR